MLAHVRGAQTPAKSATAPFCASYIVLCTVEHRFYGLLGEGKNARYMGVHGKSGDWLLNLKISKIFKIAYIIVYFICLVNNIEPLIYHA